MKQVTELLASYRSLRSSLVKYSRQAAGMVQWQLALAEQRSGEVLAQTELLVNELTRRAEQELSVQLKRVMDYKDTVLTGFSILQNTMEGTNQFVSNQRSNSLAALPSALKFASTGLTITKNLEYNLSQRLFTMIHDIKFNFARQQILIELTKSLNLTHIKQHHS